MALGDELAVLTACDDELYVLIGARALCVQCARTRTLLRKSMPRHVVACMPHGHGRQQSAPRGRIKFIDWVSALTTVEAPTARAVSASGEFRAHVERQNLSRNFTVISV